MEIRRLVFASLFAVAGVSGLTACSHHQQEDDGGDVDAPQSPDSCSGLSCFQVDCTSKGLPPTSISGTVFAPNGTLPLYGVNVYVPINDPGPLTDGATCDRCDAGLPGGSLVQIKTDEAGHFQLDDVPATGNVPLVIQIGKWRRQVVVPNVAACQDTSLTTTDTTLPKDHTQGDLPHIAITTGSADALECLVLKLGIDPSEFTNNSAAGHVHLYQNPHTPTDSKGNMNPGQGAIKFKAGWPGGDGALFGDATAMWNDPNALKNYDIVMFSCEGGQYPTTKPQTALQAVHDYADLGGRVFMSHWHNIWVGGEQGNAAHGLADWEQTATFNFSAPQDQENTIASVDESVPKGQSFAQWLVNVGASTTRDQIPITGARYTLPSNNAAMSDRRVYLDQSIAAVNGHVSVQDLEFTTPVTAATDDRCGKVVFSDMHVASGSSSNKTVPFPNGCSTTDLSPQEKALAFIFFDISSCVGQIF